jgi:hypothetical protein
MALRLFMRFFSKNHILRQIPLFYREPKVRFAASGLLGMTFRSESTEKPAKKGGEAAKPPHRPQNPRQK